MNDGAPLVEHRFAAVAHAGEAAELVAAHLIDALGDVGGVAVVEAGRRVGDVVRAAAVGLLGAARVAEGERLVLGAGIAEAVVAVAGVVEIAEDPAQIAGAEDPGGAAQGEAQLAEGLLVGVGAAAVDVDLGVAVLAGAPVVAVLPAQGRIDVVLGRDPGGAVHPADVVVGVDEAGGHDRVGADHGGGAGRLVEALAADAGDGAPGIEEHAEYARASSRRRRKSSGAARTSM